MKETVCGILGVIGAAIAGIFGGWNASLTTLLILMAIDYVSGMVVAGVFHASNKSDDGTLNSDAGWKGLAKKCMALLFVLIAHRLDMAMGTTYIKDGVTIAFIVNELLSVTENAGLMGVPIPAPVTDAIEVFEKEEGVIHEPNHEGSILWQGKRIPTGVGDPICGADGTGRTDAAAVARWGI